MVEFDDVKKIAWKCDLCTDRLDLGLQPACVAACPSHCIYFGDISKIKRKLGKSKLPRWYQKDAVSQTDKTPEK
jgi:Fe-S-cluster-containing dehydrogenase component